MTGTHVRSVAALAAAVALATGGEALAQDAAQVGPTVAPPGASSPPAQADVATASDSTIGDIVVTATKQSQSLQRVPVAITAVGGDALVARGIADVRALQAVVPSARLQQEEASIEVYIRGVGSTLDYPQFEPPTSVNFNGIYIPREGTSVGFYDVDQVEVLPGPQGTLYGGNTIGGTVNVNFRRPTHTAQTEAVLEGGNYSTVHATLVQNLPLSSVLAIRGAIDYTYHTGYQKSGADSADNIGARLSLLYTPVDAVSVYVWGAIADLNGHPANIISKGVDPSGALHPDRWLNDDPWDDRFKGATLAQAQAFGFGQVQAGTWRYSNKIVGGELNIHLSDDVTLTYVPSYLKLFTLPTYYITALPASKSDHYEQTTHELRLSGKSGPVKWVGGLYGYYRTGDDAFLVGGFTQASGGFPVTLVDHTRIEGIAGFGQAIVSLNERLRVTVGGRYSLDDRIGNGRFFNGAGLSPFTYAGHFHRLDYKAGVDFDVTPKILAYANTQTGYQPGTFNPFANTATLSNRVDPAKLTAYTAGFKSRLFGDTVQINDEVFYYDYRGLFISAYDTVNQTNRTFNAKKVEIYGDQLDMIFKPGRSDELTLSVGYLHARYKSFTLPGGGASYDGTQLQYAPDWTSSAGYRHDVELRNGYLRGSVNGHYESSFFGDYAHTPGGHQKPYVKADASLTYYPRSERWSLGLWVRNFTNVAVSGAEATGSTVPNNPLGETSFVEPPRTFGARATLKL